MTEAELEIVRIKMRLELTEYLHRRLLMTMARGQPDARQWLQNLAGQLRGIGPRVIPGLQPEWSDLATQEWSQVVDDFLRPLERE